MRPRMFLLPFEFLFFLIGLQSATLPTKICKKRASCERIFVWNSERSNFLTPFDVALLKTNYRDSIQGEIIRVLADDMLPYITSTNYSQKLGGFLGDAWRMIETSLGFTSKVSSVYYDTGLQIISAGKADILLAAVVAKTELLNVRYSQPYFYNWYHLTIKMPKARASSLSYLKTFDVKLWLLTLFVFIFLTMVLWLSTQLLRVFCRNRERNVSPVSCFLTIVSGFINQGFDLKLSSYSGRMQVMFALILGVVLYSAMNAVLVAQLAVFDIPFPFGSLDDIANRRTHSLCLRSNSFVYNNFTNKQRAILPNWEGVLNGRNCKDIKSLDNLTSILCNDGVVILENRAVMGLISKTYNISCKIINSQKRLFKTGNSFLFVKNFKHKELIDNMLERMRSTGILQRLENKWIRKGKSINLNRPQSPQVTLDHISGVLLLYFNLILISLLVLITEVIYHKST